MRMSKTSAPLPLGLACRLSARTGAGAEDLHAQVQPRAGPEGALSRRLHEVGQARRGAHQGRPQDRGLPLRAARQGRGHHRADPPGRQYRPEHRLRAHGQLCAGHRRDERPLLRRDPRGRGQAAQGADRHEVAGGARHQVRPEGVCHSTGCRAIGTSSPTSRSGRRTTSRDCASARRRRRSGRNRSARSAPTPVAMAFGEMYPGLQQRAIDGVELVYNNIPGGRFYEVLKFANETKHIMLINFEVVSAKWFDSLPKEYQARPDRGVRQGWRGDLEADLQARGRGRAAAQGPRHDDRRRTSISPRSARPGTRPTRC